jgi:hypothetical protein
MDFSSNGPASTQRLQLYRIFSGKIRRRTQANHPKILARRIQRLASG